MANGEAIKRSGRHTISVEEIESCIAVFNAAETKIEAGELTRIIEGFLDTPTAEKRVVFMRRYWFSESCGQPHFDINELTLEVVYILSKKMVMQAKSECRSAFFMGILS